MEALQHASERTVWGARRRHRGGAPLLDCPRKGLRAHFGVKAREGYLD